MVYIKRVAERLPAISPLTVTLDASDELTAVAGGVVSQRSVCMEVRIRKDIVN